MAAQQLPDSAPFALISDEPVTDPAADLLGRSRAARRLARLLRASRASTPFTLAVDAGWGMGKSTLMRLVDARLSKHPDVETVWYNAWTSTGADALEGLIKSVLVQFGKRRLRRSLARISERRALSRVLQAVLTLAAGPLGVAGLVDQIWERFAADAQSRNAMRQELRRLTQEWAESMPSTQRMLVVFVDDLDRCSDEEVLAVCEAVKVYLDVPGIAFVIGCDRSAMGPNGLLRDHSPAVSAFMEKIFQTSYRIPVADGDGVGAYIEWCARTAGVQQLLNEDLTRLLTERSARNPRRIKRLVNGFVLEATLNPVWDEFPPEAVIRTLVLQYFYPEFYRMMSGASGGQESDVVREFGTYRQVRRAILLSPGASEELGEDELVGFFGQYDLFLPNDGRAEALEVLESRLPEGFPELAVDQGFTSLLEELLALGDVERLLVRLREGVPALAPEEPPAYGSPPQYGPPPAYGSPPAYPQQQDPVLADESEPRAGQPLDVPLGAAPVGRALGPIQLKILWVDDHHEYNEEHIRYLHDRGTLLTTVSGRAAAEQAMSDGAPDLLISDISRGSDQSAGLDDLAEWRNSELYTGPALFFVNRITSERRSRAAELGAVVTASGKDLMGLIQEQAAATQSFAVPLARAARKSAPRP